MCEVDSQGEAALWAQGAQTTALGQSRGVEWGRGLGELQEGGACVCWRLICIVAWQELTQYCEAITLGLKINFKNLKKKLENMIIM